MTKPEIESEDRKAVRVNRDDRSTADQPRTDDEGTHLTMAQRKARLRAEWSNDVLPRIGDRNGFHYVWLSTTNSTDPVYRRLQMGYELVKPDDVPELGKQYHLTQGEYAGCVACNEMLLARIPDELYQELMLINHHERPLEEEQVLQANATSGEEDSKGNELLTVIGSGIDNLGVSTKAPKFA